MITKLFILLFQYILCAQQQVDVPAILRPTNCIDYTSYETVNPLVATEEEFHEWLTDVQDRCSRSAFLPRLELSPACDHWYAKAMESKAREELKVAREAALLHSDRNFGPYIDSLVADVQYWSTLEIVLNKENQLFDRRVALSGVLQ